MNAFVGSTKSAVEMMQEMGIAVEESIVVNELCEFKGRDKVGHPVPVTAMVRTIPLEASEDVVPPVAD